MKIKAMFAAALGLGIVGAALAQDWGDSTDQFASGPEFRASRALCRQLRGREPPAADRPDAAARRSLAGCHSPALYYGIGVARDPVRARLCAFVEIEENRADHPFSGRTMLMTVYANGRGARRDLDVAIHLACGIDGAPYESHGRISHLAALKAGGPAGSDFDFCDDITSGLAMGYCASMRAEIAAARREADFAALSGRWTVEQRRAFAGLRRVHAAFVEAVGDNEVDLSGTARGMMVVSAEEALRDDFLTLLRRLEAGRPPRAGAFAAADGALNRAYAARRSALGREPFGTVSWDGVRQAQRAWLAYRDAFLAFARIKYPRVSRDTIAALLTARRTAMLHGAE